MLVSVWSREFPTVLLRFYGLVTLSVGDYVPWAMLVLYLALGSRLMPELLGFITGHLYYFLTVLHSLATRTNMLKTPLWVHKMVASLVWGPPVRTRSEPNSATDGYFQGRSFRLGGR